ncbi:hypothetical protein ACFX1R_006576 [Malus domestica]
MHPKEIRRQIVAESLLKASHIHDLHQLIYYSVYANWDATTKGRPLYWFPSRFSQEFSVHNPEAYWSVVLKELSVSFREAPNCIVDRTDK